MFATTFKRKKCKQKALPFHTFLLTLRYSKVKYKHVDPIVTT